MPKRDRLWLRHPGEKRIYSFNFIEYHEKLFTVLSLTNNKVVSVRISKVVVTHNRSELFNVEVVYESKLKNGTIIQHLDDDLRITLNSRGYYSRGFWFNRKVEKQ